MLCIYIATSSPLHDTETLLVWQCFVVSAVVDEESTEATRLCNWRRARHQGPRLLPANRLGEDREPGGAAAIQAADCE